MSKLKTGDIVKFDIKDKQYAKDGFAMGGIFKCANDELEIFRRIDIETFPSCNDFKGATTKVKHGNIALILRKVGRPFKIQANLKEWETYDVYEVLTSQFTICCAFKYNLKKIF